MRRTVFCIFLLTGLISCQKTPTEKEIITQSIETHGFSKKLDSLSYNKTTLLFYPDGSTEKNIVQSHHIKWILIFYSTVKTQTLRAAYIYQLLP